MYSDKFIYIHIPKTAGTSIAHSLKEYEKIPFPPHTKLFEYEKKVDTNVFKFASVRNPWCRMLSWYFFDQQNKGPYRDTFENFLKSVNRIISSGNGKIFTSQLSFIRNSERKVDVDYIIRFEKLQEGFDEVCDKLKIPKRQLHKLNPSTRTENYYMYYNPSTKKLVEKMYPQDIEYFKYKF